MIRRLTSRKWTKPGSGVVSRRTVLRLLGVAAAGNAAAGRGRTASTPGQWFGANGWNGFRSARRAGDGYLLTGFRTTSFDEQVGWAVRLDGDLDVVWNRTYQSPPHLEQTDRGEDHDGFEFALPDGDDGFLLVGWWHTLGSDSRYGWLVRIDAEGSPRWSRMYRRSNVNSFRDDFAGGVRTDDGYVLVGRTIAGEFLDERSGDGWVVAVRDDSRVEWERAYNTQDAPAEGFSDDEHHAEFSAVTTTGDGYLVVGESSPDGPTEGEEEEVTAGWLLHLNADGGVNWSRTHQLDGSTRNEFRDVVSTDDGYVLAGCAGQEEYVRPLHDYEMQGRGWVLGVNDEGDVQWEDDAGDGFHAVSPSANGTLLAGTRGEQGWAVEYDSDGSRTGREATESAADSAYASVARTPGGHLLAGYGQQDGDLDGLLAEIRGDGDESEDGDDGDDGEDGEDGEEGEESGGDEDSDETGQDDDETGQDEDSGNEDGSEDDQSGDDGGDDTDGSGGDDNEGETDETETETATDGGDDDTDEELDHLLEIEATGRGRVEYEFEVEGAVERASVVTRLKSEGNDQLVENAGGTVTVAGVTGTPGFGDSFRFAGTVRSFKRTGGDAGFVLRLDGDRVSIDEVPG